MSERSKVDGSGSHPGPGPGSNYRCGFVAILGRPNAGKSTLLNALTGTKLAIVASKPQTTRTSIQGVRTTPEAQIVFMDTPGIHKAENLLHKHMMDMVRSAADSPDLVLFVIDALAPASEEDVHAVDLVKKTGRPAIALLNKIDWLSEKPKLLEIIQRYQAMHDFAAYIPVSALKGEGLAELEREIVGRLPQAEPMFPEDYLTDQPERFLAAEILREKILHVAKQEVPHAVAVGVDSWQDDGRLLRIAATIYVERPGQKAIVIGAQGLGLKKIGTAARQEMERTFGRKVFLETMVKVRPRWRENPAFLPLVDWRGGSRM